MTNPADTYELMEVLKPDIRFLRPLDCPGDMEAFQKIQALAEQVLNAGYRKIGNQSN